MGNHEKVLSTYSLQNLETVDDLEEKALIEQTYKKRSKEKKTH